MSETVGEKMKNLFNNPGKKIKKLATILFWVGTASYVILAFAFGWEERWSNGYYKAFHAEIFFPLILAGPISSYITALFIAGFGELIEKVSVLTNTKDSDNSVVNYHN